MLRPRITPCLLVKGSGLVKTVNFGSPKYVGDSLNAVRIFNEKEVDEIIVFDIDASVGKREPNYGLIGSLAAECRMPLCYGGGVRTSAQVEQIIALGVEKVALSSAAVETPDLIREASAVVGSQSIAVVMDVRRKRSGTGYEVFIHNGRRATGLDAFEFARRAEALGAGEIVVNSIDCDGVMKGYDLTLARQLRENTHLPITVLGGAGSLKDIEALITTMGTVGAAAGSLFVFKGSLRAVLINYPNRAEKDALLGRVRASLP